MRAKRAERRSDFAPSRGLREGAASMARIEMDVGRVALFDRSDMGWAALKAGRYMYMA